MSLDSPSAAMNTATLRFRTIIEARCCAAARRTTRRAVNRRSEPACLSNEKHDTPSRRAVVETWDVNSGTYRELI